MICTADLTGFYRTETGNFDTVKVFSYNTVKAFSHNSEGFMKFAIKILNNAWNYFEVNNIISKQGCIFDASDVNLEKNPCIGSVTLLLTLTIVLPFRVSLQESACISKAF